MEDVSAGAMEALMCAERNALGFYQKRLFACTCLLQALTLSALIYASHCRPDLTPPSEPHTASNGGPACLHHTDVTVVHNVTTTAYVDVTLPLLDAVTTASEEGGNDISARDSRSPAGRPVMSAQTAVTSVDYTSSGGDLLPATLAPTWPARSSDHQPGQGSLHEQHGESRIHHSGVSVPSFSTVTTPVSDASSSIVSSGKMSDPTEYVTLTPEVLTGSPDAATGIPHHHQQQQRHHQHEVEDECQYESATLRNKQGRGKSKRDVSDVTGGSVTLDVTSSTVHVSTLPSDVTMHDSTHSSGVQASSGCGESTTTQQPFFLTLTYLSPPEVGTLSTH